MRAILAVTLISTVLGGCVSEVADTTTSIGPTSTTMTTSTTTTTLAPATSTTAEQQLDEVAVYFFFQGYPVEPGPYLVPVARSGDESLDAALAFLLEGITATEAEMGLSSAIPEGTRLLGVEVSSGVAAIDLSGEFESGGGSLSVLGRVAQVVYTATRFDGVDSVEFLIDGVAVDVLTGEGLLVEEPQTRADYTDLTPVILIEEPLWGSTVGSQVTISGLGRNESGSISYAVVDAEGLIVAEGEIPTTPGDGGAFDTGVGIPATVRVGMGSIIVFEIAPDGTQRHVLEYPLQIGG